MSPHESVPRYGVRVQNAVPNDAVSIAAEELRLLGYTILDSGYPPAKVEELKERFEGARQASWKEHGEERLRSIDEHNTIRCPLSYDRAFLDLAMNDRVLALCEAMMGPGFILNQQNGITNPANSPTYNQAFYHRDLPYQHFVSSRPLAINALYCIDDFTTENGSTLVLPATHKDEAFPSDRFVLQHQVQVSAPAGSFIVLDCMLYHRGGQNGSNRDRRAVNHVYTIGLMRQQIEFPAFLGEGFSSDPVVRRLLGYDYAAPRSPAEYYASRIQKVSKR